MTHFRQHTSSRRLLRACLILTLLALPWAGTLHCEAAHEVEHTPAPLAGVEACCVFLCLIAVIGLLPTAVYGLSVLHGALDLQPVRLTYRPARWVPPPRPIDPRS